MNYIKELKLGDPKTLEKDLDLAAAGGVGYGFLIG